MSNVKPLDYLSDPHLSPSVKEFLKHLNGGGPPVESLAVPDARKVPVDVQGVC